MSILYKNYKNVRFVLYAKLYDKDSLLLLVKGPQKIFEVLSKIETFLILRHDFVFVVGKKQTRFSIICSFLPNPASIEREEQNKKLSPLGIELKTSRSSVQCSTDCARQESVGREISEVSFVSCTTLHFGLSSFLELIEHDFIKAFMIHTHNQIVT